MTNKTTKRALLSSVFALVLCFTMLLGTTFAWFTDSVTSGSNVIQTGNLDVEVEYTLDGKTWKKLDGANDIFQKGLWEPGHTEVVALKIMNNGSLALKYAANMNIINEVFGINKNGEKIVLSDILQVTTIIQEANIVGDILVEKIFEGSKNTDTSSTKSFKSANVLGKNETLAPGSAHYVCITVNMPNVGNEANAKDKESVPSIEFGINVFATQNTYEEDSFGNAYDEDAKYDDWNTLADTSWYAPDVTEFTLTTASQLAGLAKIVNTGVDSFEGKTVALGSSVSLEHLNWTPIGTSANQFKGTFNGNGKTISNLYVESTSGFAGLFGYVNGSANISSLRLRNVLVNSIGYTGAENSNAGYYAGALAGYSNGAVTISDVTVTGEVKIFAEALNAGGIIGASASATITNCTVSGEDGSYVKSEKYAAGICGYDNGAYIMSGCSVENVKIETVYYAGGLAGLGGVSYNKTKSPQIFSNSVKNVELVVTSSEAKNANYYGVYVGGVNLYSYSKKPLVLYENTYENVTCTVNGTSVCIQEMGSKFPDGTDKGLVIMPTLKAGNGYHSFLKAAVLDAPNDGTEFVIELVGDSMFTANVKPTIAKGQNIVIKTNGYKLLFVESDDNGALYNEDGTLQSVEITNENKSSYISIKTGGALVIE